MHRETSFAHAVRTGDALVGPAGIVAQIVMPAREPLAPDERKPWQPSLQLAEPLPQLARADLVYEVLDARERWVSVCGLPGFGRTTLLGQISDALSERGARHRAIWTASRAAAAYDFFVFRRRGDTSALARWMRGQAAADPEGTFTLLIDDFDQVATERYLAVLAELLERVPRLRLVTSSIDPLHLDERFDRLGTDLLMRIPAARLLFCAEEVEELHALASGMVWGTPPIQRNGAAATATDSALTSDASRSQVASIREIFETTRGIPVAVGLALERYLSQPEFDRSDLPRLMQTLHSSALRVVTPRQQPCGATAILGTLSLMSRFTPRQLVTIFPDASQVDLDEVLAFPAIDHRRTLIAGELVWSDAFWQAALQVNVARGADRRALANRLYLAGDVACAFEQWLLANDLAQAESVLRTRFLTVFETATPEAVREVREFAPSQLRDFPLIRAMQVLLYADPSIDELQQSLANLARMGAKSGASTLVPRAVRAAVLARKGVVNAARAEAGQVIAEAEALAAAVLADADLDDLADGEAELLSLAEASLTATLAYFESEAIPRCIVRLPRIHGSRFLAHRIALAQAVLDSVRDVDIDHVDLPEHIVPVGYRTLVFSPAACAHEVAAMAAFDGRFTGAAGDGGAHDGPIHLRILSPAVDCMDKLMTGNLSGAIEAAYRADVSEPIAGMLRAIVLLASGRDDEALELLDRADNGWGTRIEAMSTVLRACAQVRRGYREPARRTMQQAEGLPLSALVQAMTTLRDSDAAALAEISPVAARVYGVVRSAGALGTGQMIAEDHQFQAITAKEMQVLEGLRDGLNTREIAEKHFLSVNTVRTHVRSIGKKLVASGQAEMVRRAEELRLFDVDTRR